MIFLIALILISAILLLCRIWTDSAVKQSEKTFPPEGQFLNIRNARIHYLRRGSGPPVVLIHGAYGSMLDFTRSIFPALVKDFDVLVFDRPGFGYSQRNSETSLLQGQVTMMRELIRELNIQKPLLVGHSLGAALALNYALHYPNDLSGVVSIGGYVVAPDTPLDPIYTFPGIPVLGPFMVDTFLGPIGKWAAGKVAESVFWPEPIPSGFLEFSTAMALRPETFKENARDIRGLTEFLTAQSSRYHEIKVPVIIVTGDSDLVSLPERHTKILKKDLPGAELIVFPNTGHQPCFTQRGQIISIIQNAWRNIEASR